MSQAPQLIRTAQSTLVRGPTEEAQRAAYTLKSIALAFGAEKLADLSRRLEEAVKHNERGQLEELLAGVEYQNARVEVSLTQFLEPASESSTGA